MSEILFFFRENGVTSHTLQRPSVVTHEKAFPQPSKGLGFQPPASCDLHKICKIKQGQNRKIPPSVSSGSAVFQKEEEQYILLCIQKAESKESKRDYNKAKCISGKEKRLFKNLNLVNPFLFNIVLINFPFNVCQFQLVICEYNTTNNFRCPLVTVPWCIHKFVYFFCISRSCTEITVTTWGNKQNGIIKLIKVCDEEMS